MRVVHVPCGAFVNHSEARAFREVSKFLVNVAAKSTAFVLTNLTHATPNRQADEVDMVVVGPSGVVVIEVKHWDTSNLRRNPDLDNHAELITAKAKRIAGRLRAVNPDLEFVPGTMLFTREAGSLRRNGKTTEHLGVSIYALKDLDALLGVVIRDGKTPVEELARTLAPRQVENARADLRRIARFDDLKLLSPPDDIFARVHSGRDPASGERVIIHSYDLSASTFGERAELSLLRAKREFDVVQRFQKSPYLPSLVDTWQPLPNYAGEVFFFTLADSGAISVQQLAQDSSWSIESRLAFASQALRALADLQTTSTPGAEPLIHRAIDSGTVRVRADGSPLFSGWRWARLPTSLTIAPGLSSETAGRHAAPEVQEGGLESARPSSDTYSLCTVLKELFQGSEAPAPAIRVALDLGLEQTASMRAGPGDIAARLETLEDSPARSTSNAVPASRWDEGHILKWNGERFRVVALLGQGGAGRTFKLEQLNGDSDDPIGTFVGKVIYNEEFGRTSLDAYKKVRSFARHDGLSDVLQTSATWNAHELMALLRWSRGEPLDAWRGEAQFLADHAGEESVEALLLRWFDDLCAALDVLHLQGWVHGDVSPSNILVDDDRVLLIDYDLASPVGALTAAPGTIPYCSPERRLRLPAQASDDVYALAASLFHVVTGRTPFAKGDEGDSNSGLGWTSDERAKLPVLSRIFDIAADPQPTRRFETAGAARRRMKAERSQATSSSFLQNEAPALAERSIQLQPNVVDRVKEILSAYPGSRFGNAETRGLDSRFARDTYVDTGLDASLLQSIESGKVSLIILCGNAGDGKTAFLQHLATQLGVPSLPSSQRVWAGKLHDRDLVINLDGAASWNGRPADELLDDLFSPFHEGPPDDARVHLVAVNDGRLMEWIEGYECRHNGEGTNLTAHLADALAGNNAAIPEYLQLIELNQRSLVGGLDFAAGQITTEFVENLVAKLIGGTEASSVWQPCKTCTAQTRCSMRSSAEMMGSSADPVILARGGLFRERLTNALQAVHQRNEIHITARELKAAISYILFGLYSCEDMHNEPDRPSHVPADYAFDATSEHRQGDVLRELARLDPGLEAHARLDRYLSGRGAPAPAHGAPRYADAQGRPLILRQARRRAYFEWTATQIKVVTGELGGLDLKDGRHYEHFRSYPLLPASDREAILRNLCLGLSRLETLPEVAFGNAEAVPIRIVPRTPTETAFWVEKPLSCFALDAEPFEGPNGLEKLHRYLTLSYQPRNGPIERLTVSLELFALLMDLSAGVQILDAFSDDVFANLTVFTQRLAQEDERSLRAWNPAREQQVFEIGVELSSAGQTIALRASA